MSLAYHWTPAEIVELTPPQLALYLDDAVEETGTVAMPVAAGEAYVAQRRAARTAWVDEMLQGHLPRQPIARGEHRAVHARPPQASVASGEPAVTRLPRSAGAAQPIARRLIRDQVIRASEQAPNRSERPRLSVIEARTGLTGVQPRHAQSTSSAGTAGSLGELAHRVTLLGEATSSVQAAVERLERKRSDSSQFA